MKKIYLLILVFVSLKTFADEKIWVGNAGDDWFTDAAWSPSGYPGTTDDIVFNSNAVVKFTVSVVGAKTLKIINNATVSFETAQKLQFGSAFGVALTIDAGASLKLRNVGGVSSNGLRLNIDGVSIVNGLLELVTGSNSGVYEPSGALGISATLIVNGTIKAGYEDIGGVKVDGGLLNGNGSVAGITFNSGAVYEISRTSSVQIAVAAWAAGATLKITGAQNPGGAALSWAGSLPISLGNLIWDCPNQGGTGSLGFNSAGSGFAQITEIKGDLIINSTGGKLLRFNSSNSNNIITTFKGNVSVNNANTVLELFSSSASAGGATSTWNFEKNITILPELGFGNNTNNSHLWRFQGSANGAGGTGIQKILVGGFSKAGLISFTINNSGNGVVLNSNIAVLKNITLLNGKISLGDFNLIAGENNGKIIGSSGSGWVVTDGTGALTYKNIPIGGANIPVGISSTSYDPIAVTPNAVDTFTVKVKNNFTNPVNNPAKVWNREWNIISPNTTGAMVEFQPDAVNATAPGITGSNVVGHFTGSIWTETPSLGAGPFNNYPYSATFTSYSPFAVGIETGFVGSTAPVVIEYIHGGKQNKNHLISWKVNCVNTPNATLVLQRSANGKDFNDEMYSINVSAARCGQPFRYSDTHPLSGPNYYRLKMVDADGKVNYSTIIALINRQVGFELVSLVPTLVNNNAALLNVSTAQKMEIEISLTDIGGRILQHNKYLLTAGSNQLPVFTERLAAGVYNLIMYTKEGNPKTIRFVKQ